ncbi:MAG: hypothetical protein A2901_02135 [Elusimicrobia bacterium RIFCSPLOWO2_01_FULL_54_10]|nr:MAG: hypothetical protein A2901_02135 [Elusimicrobia bacterium RIFCSPLOWO2_01_FULL_54_10]
MRQILVLALFFSAAHAFAGFSAGAAKAKMTPDVSDAANPVWLAGYQGGRAATGVHDDLWITALAMNHDQGSVLFITVDLIGYMFDEVAEVKNLIHKELDIAPSKIFIFSTHNHSGPDSIGLWGKDGKTGKDQAYLDSLRRKILACAGEAVKSMKPVRAVFGKTRYDNPIEDSRPPKIINDLLLSMKLTDMEGHTIATLVNYAMHAEVLNGKNTLLTSDYPGVLREQLEKKLGGVAIYITGDIGGMQSPFVLFHTFWSRERVGKALAVQVLQSLMGKLPEEVPYLRAHASEILFPIENKRYIQAIESGMFGRSSQFIQKAGDKYFLPADVAFVQIGPAQFITVPGEAFPEVGNVLRGKMAQDYPFVLGLANNEIGYIVPDDQWNDSGYEENMSLGPQTTKTLLKAVSELLDKI